VKKEKMKAKKGEGEGGERFKKAIIGIALAAIMLASVFVAMMPTATALPLPDTSYNGLYHDIDLKDSPPAAEPVLIGQYLWLHNLSYSGATIQGDPTASDVAGEIFTADSDGKFDTTLMTKTGIYYVNQVGGTTTASPTYWEAQLAVTKPLMILKLKPGGDEVSGITEGPILEIDFLTTLDAKDMVSLVIIDPDGNTIKEANGQYFDKINVSWIRTQYGVGKGIDTTDWKLGTYTFKVVTEKDGNYGARGLEDEPSNVKALTIIISEIGIDADKTSVAELERLKLTVTGVVGHNIWISTSDKEHTTFPGGVNNNPAYDCSDFGDMIDADGKRTYAVEFNDTGYYTITVTDMATGDDDIVDITVTEKAVTFDMPTTVVIGERLTIKGIANTGDWVQIAVDDIICDKLRKLVIDENGEFEKMIDTSTACAGAFAVPGYVRLKAFIDTNFCSCSDVSYYTDDGSTKLFMVGPWLTASLSTDSVDSDDEFTICGTAKGSKEVNILIVAPGGSSGSVISGSSGDRMINKRTDGTYEKTNIYYKTTSVSRTDDTFEKKIDVGNDVDTGSYLVILISPGPDGKYGKYGDDKLVSSAYAAFAPYYFAAKTQDEVLAIIEDAIALSDDLLWVGYVKVGEIETLTLNPIGNVVVGNPLEVTGATSRKDGSIIWITVKKPYYEIVPQAAIVEDNMFNATFDTTGAQHGTYTVRAIDGYRNAAATTVDIIAETPA